MKGKKIATNEVLRRALLLGFASFHTLDKYCHPFLKAYHNVSDISSCPSGRKFIAQQFKLHNTLTLFELGDPLSDLLIYSHTWITMCR